MSMRLKVTEASVHTAQVEVKTLTISGKQVTLAVFRQLLEEPLISGEGHLKGAPWGVVNYHPDKACKHKPSWEKHLHVVWQLGDELRRASVEEPRDNRLYPESGSA